MKPRAPNTELESLADNSVAPIVVRLRALIRAEANFQLGVSVRADGARDRFRTMMAEMLTLGDLMGRRRAFLNADRMEKAPDDLPQLLFADSVIKIAPGKGQRPAVKFDEVVSDLLDREPRLADDVNGLPRYIQVQEFYRTGRAFAVARSAELEITKRVQAVLAAGLKKGRPVETTEAVLSKLKGFDEAYATTVYRTNLVTAYTAGKFQQMKLPEVMAIVGAFQFSIVGDIDTRDNHRATNTMLAPANSEIWRDFAPPIGYNCRCDVREVSRFELKRRKLVQPDGRVLLALGRQVFDTAAQLRAALAAAGAFPDAGFGGRSGSGVLGAASVYQGKEGIV